MFVLGHRVSWLSFNSLSLSELFQSFYYFLNLLNSKNLLRVDKLWRKNLLTFWNWTLCYFALFSKWYTCNTLHHVKGEIVLLCVKSKNLICKILTNITSQFKFVGYVFEKFLLLNSCLKCKRTNPVLMSNIKCGSR